MIDDLGEDVVAHIVSFLDLHSLLQFSQTNWNWHQCLLLMLQRNTTEETSLSLSSSSSSSSEAMRTVWKDLFHRLAFSREDLPTYFYTCTPTTSIVSDDGENTSFLNYWHQMIRYRKALQHNLFGQQQRRRQQQPCEGGLSMNKQSNHCFLLPNHRFSFLPVIPDDVPIRNLDEEEDADADVGNANGDAELFSDLLYWWDDPPPVHFHCDSFILTSTAVGGELLFLNPFSKTLTVYASILDNAIHSDEGMMEHAIREAASLIMEQQQQQQHNETKSPSSLPFLGTSPDSVLLPETLEPAHQQQHQDPHSEEIDLAASAIAMPVQRNHSMHQDSFRVQPRYELISLQDSILDIDLMSYFWAYAPQQQQRWQRNFHHHDDDDDIDDEDNDDSVEVEIDYLGIDAKPVLDTQLGLPTGTTMYTVGRFMSNSQAALPPRQQQQQHEQFNQDPLECFESIAWFRGAEDINKNNFDKHSNKYVCRVRGDLLSVDCCATQRRIYVNPLKTTPPSTRNNDNAFLMQEEEEDDDNNDREQGNWLMRGRTSKILVYPMIRYENDDKMKNNQGVFFSDSTAHPSKYFPQPTHVLDCQDLVSTFAVCATGSHLIAATVTSKLLFWRIGTDDAGDAQVEQTISLTHAVQSAFESRPSLIPQAVELPVHSIICPRGISIETTGFCTLQSVHPIGSTVLLWHKICCDKDKGLNEPKEWCLHTMINLPLSARHRPQVHYDGNRLIVFGQDHIGFIILVYRVRSTPEHLAVVSSNSSSRSSSTTTNTTTTPVLQEDSGGVVHLTSTRRVEFVNRIRHAALGGIEDYESLRMTCNERFIAVNTKTGNLLSDGSVPFLEGILIIDLEYDKLSH